MPQAPTENESAQTCPVRQSHGRLHQAHRLWHLLHAAYPQPDDFVLQLNAAVEGFRNITFILQNELKAVPGGADWYAQWQERMRADQVMRWLHDSRTTVVHKGDLETYSTATVSLRASWYGPQELMTIEVPPFLPTEAMGTMLMERLHPPEIIQKEGVLEIERRWIEKGLPDREILDSLAHCYGILSELLTEAHARCDLTMKDIFEWDHSASPSPHLGNLLPCMLMSEQERTARFHLGTGEIMSEGTRTVNYDPDIGDKGRERYGLDSLEDQFATVASAQSKLTRDEVFLDYAKTLVEVGKKVLATDHCHYTMAFVHTPDGTTEMMQLMPEDQQEKYLLIQRVADCVHRLGADQLLFITEAWEACGGAVSSGQRPADVPSKTEALLFIAVTARGPEHSRQWRVPFSRSKSGDIEFGTTQEGWLMYPQFLAPVFKVWGELWPDETLSSGAGRAK